MHFFPFSIDPTVFYQRNGDRELKVGFAGTQRTGNAMSGGSVYLPREKAYSTLHSAGLLASKTTPAGQLIQGDDYVNYLQQYAIYLSCGSIYNLTPSKMFEIMASGGVLLTNKMPGLDVLFPEGSYITYKNDASDVVQNVKAVFDDTEKLNSIVEKGLACIKEHHTHDIRIKQMFEIIGKYQ